MDEQSSVSKFIESSGFPLEFAAADALTKVGFITHQGRTYEAAGTPEGGETTFREIDVVADLIDTRSPMPIHVVVECKHLTAPWVVISGEGDRSANVQPILSMSTYVDPGVLAELSRQAFDIKPPISFGVVQVVSKPNDPAGPKNGGRSINQAFDAVRQVLSAAMGAAKQLQQGDHAHLIHPVLVVEGSGLWLYESRQEPRPVPRARLVWWGAPSGQAPAIVDVVSRAEFSEQYLLDLRERLVTLCVSISATGPTAGPYAMFP
jgi:hypothetical protein